MKNQLIPITRFRSDSDFYEPTLVPLGFKHRYLVKSRKGGEHGYYTNGDNQGFSWRHDLEGIVKYCGGMPIIQIDDGSLFVIRNTCSFLYECWKGLP